MTPAEHTSEIKALDELCRGLAKNASETLALIERIVKAQAMLDARLSMLEGAQKEMH